MANSQPAFTEKDMLQDILVLEKDIVKTYGSYIIESSCPKMRTVLNNNMKASAEDQYCVFDNMSKRGLYPTEQAPMQKLTQAKTKFAGIKQNISN